MTLIVGITGGIGSGKTTVTQVFEHLGVPVYRSDDQGRRLLMNDALVHQQIEQAFGAGVFSGGKPDRQELARIVFSDPGQLARLNEIIHPAVGLDFERWLQQHSNAAYVLKESAILIENNLHGSCDHLILVSAPEEVRIERVMARDKTTEAEVKQRMNNQWSDDRKREFAHFEIVNDGLRAVLTQVLPIHGKLSQS